MRKKIIWLLIACSILFYIYLIFFPVILDKKKALPEIESSISHKRGDKIKVFDSFDFKKGKWKVCVIITDRIGISPNIPHGRYLYTEDITVIERLKTLSFEYTGGDMATIENEIILYKDDEMIFRSGILVDKKKEGLQNRTFGWIKDNNNEMSKIIQDFELNMLPFVRL